jgi:hypothetical protein
MASISVSSPPSHVNPAIPQQRSGLGDKCRWPGKVERKRANHRPYARLKMSQCRSPCKMRTPPRSCWPFCRPGPERRQQIPMATSQSGHRSPPHPRATHDKAHAGVNLCERRRSGHSRPTKETPHPLNIIQVSLERRQSSRWRREARISAPSPNSQIGWKLSCKGPTRASLS